MRVVKYGIYFQLPECRDLPASSGQRIPCLIEFMDNITEPACHQFLRKMANIVFGDYHLVYHFMESCEADVKKFTCGRMENEMDTDVRQSYKQLNG